MDMVSVLTTLDYIVFVTILILTCASIIYGNKLLKKEDKSDSVLSVLLMGRKLTLPLFIATLVSTWYGGIFGVTQIAYDYGIYNFITQGVFWYVSYLIFAIFMVNRIKRNDVKTLPELTGKLFGPKSSYVAGIFNLLNVIPIAYALSLGIFIDTMFQTGVFYGTLFGTIFVVGYSIFGGFRAIVFSDLIQFFVMVSSVILIVVFSYGTLGGFDFLKENLPDTHFSLTGGQPISTLLVWGFIAMSTLVDPNFYQRVFAASDKKTAKKGIFVSTGIWCVFDICTTAGAMYAAAHMPNLESSHAYLTYGMSILPDGLRGFFIAGILATILSTLDSYIFVASTTVVYDLLHKATRFRFTHQIATISIGLTAAILSTVFEGGIKDIWKTLGSYSAGCLLIPLLWGLFSKQKISDRTFVFATFLGAVGITVWRFLERSGFWENFDDLYVGMIITFAVFFMATIKSKLTSTPSSS